MSESIEQIVRDVETSAEKMKDPDWCQMALRTLAAFYVHRNHQLKASEAIVQNLQTQLADEMTRLRATSLELQEARRRNRPVAPTDPTSVELHKLEAKPSPFAWLFR